MSLHGDYSFFIYKHFRVYLRKMPAFKLSTVRSFSHLKERTIIS